MKILPQIGHSVIVILQAHEPYYADIFSIPGFLQDPALSFGFQDIGEDVIVNGQRFENVEQLFAAFGLRTFSLDYFDPRAALRYDMNSPVPQVEHNRYGTLIDIGSIEHVFDTRQCLENCIRMLRVGGHYMVVTPVSGYFGHGLHSFHPEALLSALEINGFKILYVKYSTREGRPVADPCKPENVVIWEDPSVRDDLLIWIAAVKESDVVPFVCPQQGKWHRVYSQ